MRQPPSPLFARPVLVVHPWLLASRMIQHHTCITRRSAIIECNDANNTVEHVPNRHQSEEEAAVIHVGFQVIDDPENCYFVSTYGACGKLCYNPAKGVGPLHTSSKRASMPLCLSEGPPFVVVKCLCASVHKRGCHWPSHSSLKIVLSNLLETSRGNSTTYRQKPRPEIQVRTYLGTPQPRKVGWMLDVLCFYQLPNLAP